MSDYSNDYIRRGVEACRQWGRDGTVCLADLDLLNSDLEKLVAEPEFNWITYLDISEGKISAEGIKRLAENLPKELQELYLSNNDIGDHEIKILAVSLPEGLPALDIYRSNISSNGAVALATHLPKRPKKLDIGENLIGECGAKALRVKLPSRLAILGMDRNQPRGCPRAVGVPTCGIEGTVHSWRHW